MSMEEIIEQTKRFVKEKFQRHPHHSFDDWSVMYNHSVTVQELALNIAEEVECDTLVVAIAALLHDIGKTYVADEETLHKHHEDFNVIVAKSFLESLLLDIPVRNKILCIISEKDSSIESLIIRDADIIAMYVDSTLHMHLIEWALRTDRKDVLERKLNNIDRLQFLVSKQIAEQPYIKMKERWRKSGYSIL